MAGAQCHRRSPQLLQARRALPVLLGWHLFRHLFRTWRKISGEYALHVDGKVVAFVCDDRLFLQPNAAAAELLGTPTLAPADPGSKDYSLLEDETEDRERLRVLLTATADALPPPKAKRARKAKRS